jgi:hypothetical protein
MRDVTEKIEVPDYVKDVCVLWHDGQASLMYSVASTGKCEYQRLFQLLNDMPHSGDDPSETNIDRIRLRNARTWLENWITDEYFDSLDQAMIQEESIYSLA